VLCVTFGSMCGMGLLHDEVRGQEPHSPHEQVDEQVDEQVVIVYTKQHGARVACFNLACLSQYRHPLGSTTVNRSTPYTPYIRSLYTSLHTPRKTPRKPFVKQSTPITLTIVEHTTLL
jgi:hypothetical protein